MSAWPESVQRVAAFLAAAGADARVEELQADTATAEAAAEAVGSDLGAIVKTLVTLCDERPVAALVPGDRRADLVKIAAAAGTSSARVARAHEVEELTGFTPGAVSPFPLPRIELVLVDTLLLAHERVWVGAGSTRHLATLPPAELVRLTNAQPVDLAEV